MIELAKNNSASKKDGVFYTNYLLAEFMIEKMNIDYKSSFRLLEPAVGEGHILLNIVQRILDFNSEKDDSFIKEKMQESIVGFDKRKEAIEICKKSLNELIKDNRGKDLKIEWNIFELDILEYQNKKIVGDFDYVICNPPYISKRNLSKEKRIILEKKSNYCNKYSYDLYYYFIESSLEYWNGFGKMVFVTPNSYLRARSANSLRKDIFRKRQVEEIFDFDHNKLFSDALTYSAVTVFSSNNTNLRLIKMDDKFKELESKRIEYNRIDRLPEYQIYQINYIEDKIEGIPLKEIAYISNGLATLADSVFFLKKSETTKDVFLDKDNNEINIEHKILRKTVRASNLDETYYLIFPYTQNKEKGVLEVMKLSENYFPLTYQYLTNNLKPQYKEKYGLGFGRTQGLKHYLEEKIIVPKVATPNTKFRSGEFGYIRAGLYIVMNEGYSDITESVLEYLNSDDVNRYLNEVSKNYSAGYKSISSRDLKEILIPMNILRRNR
ncbi:N-6 DNA methylase [Erysipelothrix enhydrae]|uniref:Eco57I restriction-modification methylase domain-containing protein n=1 Tax=Erysipelothrix enhydrae TaxID=2890314 RepID=UPI002B24044C|nr:N-6 DNA methylase [Erysipelothrix sp. 4322-04]WRB87235.1 N-6 DNA methylase [Erysipelothrix sp. 4322-04]